MNCMFPTMYNIEFSCKIKFLLLLLLLLYWMTTEKYHEVTPFLLPYAQMMN